MVHEIEIELQPLCRQRVTRTRQRVAKFIDIEELPETDSGLGLVWEEVENAPNPATVDADLSRWVEEARRRGARILFAAVPSDLCANLNEPFQATGFTHHGRLIDYFAPNIHQELGSLRLR